MNTIYLFLTHAGVLAYIVVMFILIISLIKNAQDDQVRFMRILALALGFFLFKSTYWSFTRFWKGFMAWIQDDSEKRDFFHSAPQS